MYNSIDSSYWKKSLGSPSGLHAKSMGFTDMICISTSSSRAIN